MVKFFKFIPFAIAACLFCGAAAAKPNQEIEPISAQALEKFDVETSNLTGANGEVYKIFFAVPKDENGAKKAKFKNALFLLDGNAQFSVILNCFDAQSMGEAPLIIGIGYGSDLAYDVKKRTRDLTPSPADESEFKGGGGAAQFYQILKEQILPLAESKFDLKDTQKSLYGHSFGGLFTLYALLQNDGLFDNFFIASSSLWWGDSQILKDARQGGKFKQNLKAEFVFVSVGENEKRENRPEKPGVLKAKDLAQTLKNSGVNSEFKLYEGQGHGDVIPLNLTDVLKRLGGN